MFPSTMRGDAVREIRLGFTLQECAITLARRALTSAPDLGKQHLKAGLLPPQGRRRQRVCTLSRGQRLAALRLR